MSLSQEWISGFSEGINCRIGQIFAINFLRLEMSMAMGIEIMLDRAIEILGGYIFEMVLPERS